VFHNRYQNRVNDPALRIVRDFAECLQKHELRKRVFTDQLVDEVLSPDQHIVSVIRTNRRCGFFVGLAVHQGLPDGGLLIAMIGATSRNRNRHSCSSAKAGRKASFSHIEFDFE
jgi:hypothetical protein